MITNCRGSVLSRAAVVLLLVTSSCQSLTPALTPTPLPTTPIPSSPTSILESTPTVVITTSTSTGTPVISSATASASPSPIGCQPPANWVEHTIRPDETLFYLASSTGVSVDDVMKANCLSNDVIVVGDRIFLPSIPPIRPTFPSLPIPSPNTACPSPFSCKQTELPPLLLDAGAPGDPNFDPCHGTLEEPWLDVSDVMIQVGDRLYVYVCEFPQDQDLTATVELPDKTHRDLPVLPVPANPDGPSGDAMGVVKWPALPDQAMDWYTLTVSATDGTNKALAFHVAPADQAHVLIVPEVGQPGSVFDVYFIYFEPNTKLQVSLYGEDVPVEKQQHSMTGRFLLEVLIDKRLSDPVEKGWAKHSFQSFASDPQGGYAIAFDDSGHAYRQLFWLKPDVEK